MVVGGDDMFHDKLRYLREHQEFSQSEVARRINIVQTTYSRYELGQREPDFRTLKKIANFFNVSIDYLLDNDDAPYANDMVDFDNFVKHGNYTICSHYPSEAERKLLSEVTQAVMNYVRQKR